MNKQTKGIKYEYKYPGKRNGIMHTNSVQKSFVVGYRFRIKDLSFSIGVPPFIFFGLEGEIG